MATLLQFNKVQTNRSGAVQDVTDGLGASSTTGTNGNRIMVAPTSIDTTIARVADAVTNVNAATGTIADARIPNLNASKINAGTLADARVPATISRVSNLITDINAQTGMIDAARIPTPDAINLSDVRSFNTVALRNAARGPNDVPASTADVNLWHNGDVAIVLGDRALGLVANVTGTGTAAIVTFASAPSPVLAAGTLFRIEGATPAGYNLSFTVVSNAGAVYTCTAASALPAAAYTASTGNGFVTDEDSSGRGTYIYTAVDQTTSAATTNADWSILIAPTDTQIDASFITSGVLNDMRIADTIARSNELLEINDNPVTGVTASANTLTFNQADGTALLTYTPSVPAVAPEIWETNVAPTESNDPDNAGMRVVVLSLAAGATNQLFYRGGPTPSSTRTMFPTNGAQVAVYVAGLRLLFSEVRVDTTANAEIILVLPADMIQFTADTRIQVEIVG